MPSDRPPSGDHRPRLDPAVAVTRTAVRDALALAVAESRVGAGGLVLVGLSGGADSLALAAAVAFEAPRAHLTAGAVIVDHGLQSGSDQVAERAARTARSLGLDPVEVTRVRVGAGAGPEDAARRARHAALEAARACVHADAILLGHTLDDQAETVLLGLARGSGATSLAGMAPVAGRLLRPLLHVPRATVRRACTAAGLEPWEDPANADPAYSRVRIRRTVLPVLETELGPGIAAALARTADLLREDGSALDQMVREVAEDVCEPAEAGVAISVGVLAANPTALRTRLVRYVVSAEFGQTLERDHVLAVLRLVTHWHGQGPLDLPGVRVERRGDRLLFTASRRSGSERAPGGEPGGS